MLSLLLGPTGRLTTTRASAERRAVLGGASGDDALVVANRLQVADYFTAKVAAGCDYGGEQTGVDALAVVTKEAATVEAAKAVIDSRCGI